MSLKASDRFLWRGYPPGPREAVHLDLRGWLHDPSLPRGTEGHSGTAVGATLVSRESRPLLHLEKIEFTPDKMCETNKLAAGSFSQRKGLLNQMLARKDRPGACPADHQQLSADGAVQSLLPCCGLTEGISEPSPCQWAIWKTWNSINEKEPNCDLTTQR